MNPRGAHIHSKPSWTDLMAFLKNPCVICSWDCAYRIIWRRKPYLIAIQKKRISSFFPHTRVSLNVYCQSETICTSGTKTIGLDSIIQDSLHPLNRNCKIQHCEIYLKDKKTAWLKLKSLPKRPFQRWFSHLFAIAVTSIAVIISYQIWKWPRHLIMILFFGTIKNDWIMLNLSWYPHYCNCIFAVLCNIGNHSNREHSYCKWAKS